MSGPKHSEQERLAALRGYGVLDSPNEPEFDAIVREAARICGVPVALISFIDENRQWFKAKVGIEASDTPRSISFCTHAIQREEGLVIEDARLDDRVSANPLVTGDPNIRFYAGVPLRTPNGARLGTLCVIDQKPRRATDQQLAELRRLADQVMVLLESRRTAARAQPRQRAA